MSPNPRQLELLEHVQAHGSVSVEELAVLFSVTLQTVRRDVRLLSAAGLLTRFHGGVRVPSSTTENLAYRQRQLLNQAAKQRIAREVARAVPEGCSLIINIGTTTEAIARELLHHKGLRVITNNLNVAAILSDNTDCEVIVTGGVVRSRDRGIVGEATVDFIRQFKADAGASNVIYIHLTLVPYIKTAGEVKTKPTQHSVKELRAIGIQPDILLCRTEKNLTSELKAKIALFCNVPTDAVITARDVKSIYEVPVHFHREGLDDKILELLNVWTGAPRIEPWEELMHRIQHPAHRVTIGIIGKYVELTESYKSLHEALVHGGLANDARVDLRYVSAEDLEARDDVGELLAGCQGILVPGGFGERGVRGKIKAISFAREQKIPFFGICLGMQLAVVEFARSIAGMNDANSTEFDLTTGHPVIYLMKEWYDFRTKKTETRCEESDKGGTMRLGSYPCKIKKDTVAHAAYQTVNIDERHRHRYEFNNEYLDALLKAGMIVSGTHPKGDHDLVEIMELKDHPWFCAGQFHPEFKSKPLHPQPLFRDFVGAALHYSEKRD